MAFFYKYWDRVAPSGNGYRTAIPTIKRTLISRLEKLGIECKLMPGFIRSLMGSYNLNPQMNLRQLNRRLHYLGWKDLDLDYHTWQLAIACYETEGCMVGQWDAH